MRSAPVTYPLPKTQVSFFNSIFAADPAAVRRNPGAEQGRDILNGIRE